MTKFQIVREDFKRQDTTNLMAIQLFDDNNMALTPNSSHTWQAKVVKGDKYAGEFSVNLRGNQIEVPAAQFTKLPSGEYGLELWETYDGKTTIYPSAGFVPFEIHRNATEAASVVDPTTNTQQLLQEMREAVKQIEFAEPIGVPAGNKPKVTQEIKNGKHIITLTLVQGERGPAGVDGITPTIGTNGNWFLGDTDTGKPSRGVQGQIGDTGPQGPAGANGITPTIGDNGNWYLGDTDTGKPSRGVRGPIGDTGPQGIQGQKGDTGDRGPAGPAGPNGLTPTIGDNGNWFLGDTDTGKPSRGATGSQGQAGVNGITPTIGDNGNWYLGDEDTGKPSRGVQGPKGEPGERGPAGAAPRLTIGSVENLSAGSYPKVTITGDDGEYQLNFGLAATNGLKPEYLPEGADLNRVIKSGVYTSAPSLRKSYSNTPLGLTNGDFFTLVVYNDDRQLIQQVFDAFNGNMFIRGCRITLPEWSSWQNISGESRNLLGTNKMPPLKAEYEGKQILSTPHLAAQRFDQGIDLSSYQISPVEPIKLAGRAGDKIVQRFTIRSDVEVMGAVVGYKVPDGKLKTRPLIFRQNGRNKWDSGPIPFTLEADAEIELLNIFGLMFAGDPTYLEVDEPYVGLVED